eukprot:6175388-Pleurochrysis_carterae.AAC.1
MMREKLAPSGVVVATLRPISTSLPATPEKTSHVCRNGSCSARTNSGMRRGHRYWHAPPRPETLSAEASRRVAALKAEAQAREERRWQRAEARRESAAARVESARMQSARACGRSTPRRRPSEAWGTETQSVPTRPAPRSANSARPRAAAGLHTGLGAKVPTGVFVTRSGVHPSPEEARQLSGAAVAAVLTVRESEVETYNVIETPTVAEAQAEAATRVRARKFKEGRVEE